MIFTNLFIGLNGKVVYRLVSGDRRGQFGVNSETGLVQVVGLLDREVQSKYDLVIEAVDLPTDIEYQLTGSTTVSVIVVCMRLNV